MRVDEPGGIGIVLRSMMIGRDGETDELCYVMYMFYLLVVIITAAIRNFHVKVDMTQCLTK